MADITNPDLVDTADQANKGLGVTVQVPDFKTVPVTASPNNKIEIGGSKRPDVVTQEILVGPSQNGGVPVDGDDPSQVKPVPQAVNQVILTGPTQNHRLNIDGGLFNPQSVNVQNTTQNNVVGQTYGTGTPKNVNVG